MPSHMSLGDYKFANSTFPDVEKAIADLNSPEFQSLSERKRFRRINQILLNLIQDAPHSSFLLPAVIDFIERINNSGFLNAPYHFSHFEFWLNQLSELNDHQNYLIRSKIVGKYIPREEYQVFFPIGMDKTFSGSHFVAAHLSPDVDTMVASFWGWVDAFAARVCNARHLWSLPGGPPDSPVTDRFYELFGSSIFSSLSHSSLTLTLAAMDLVSQKGFLKKKGDTSISSLESGNGDIAVILIDEKGHYLGDWHRSDVDPIRQIIIRFKSCLRWFENNLHVELISLFAKKKLHTQDIPVFFASIFDVPINECEPVKEFEEKQKKDLHNFFLKVLGLKNGLKSSFGELIQSLLKVKEVNLFQQELNLLASSEIFDEKGNLREDRPAIFNQLEKIINLLDNAIHYIRDYAERLDIAISIKSKVLGIPFHVATMRSDVDDIRIKMQRQEYLTVVVPEGEDSLYPVGVVWSNIIQRPTLGTVSFRDFCNQEEVKMASYLSPISVVDHHKASLKTASPPMALIGDAQSCNVIIAEQTFKINSKFSLGGMDMDAIDESINDLHKLSHKRSNTRILQRLLQKKMAAHSQGNYYIHPEREIAEYLSFLHAILDDTDLLTKVSQRDIECVVELLNRVKSLIGKKEIEVVNLDDIPRDKSFVLTAAKRILHNSEMYSLYRRVYESKEKEIERNLLSCEKVHCENLFADTKEQNGCCRVGQTKLFSINFPSYYKNIDKLREYWIKNAETVNKEHPEIDLHLHMISTISSASEVYQDKVGHYQHQDELWFWVPPTQKAYDHLASFLTAFQSAQNLGPSTYFEFFSDSEELQQVFNQNYPDVPHRKAKGYPELPLVVLYFGAGLLNSRKAMITPYLPKIIS